MRRRSKASSKPVKRRSYHASGQKLLKALPGRASAAELQQQLDRRTHERDEAREQQVATAEILRVIRTSPTDVQPVFDTIVRNAVSLCGSLFANVFRFDGELLHFVAAHNVGANYVDLLQTKYPMRPDSSQVSGRVMLTKSVVRIEDARTDSVYDQRFPPAMGWRRMLGVPMLRENDPLGVIVVGWAEAGPVPKVQEELLKTFADQAVIAIENARLLNELRQSLQQQTATAEVLKVVSRSTFDLQPVLDTLTESAARLCEADMAGMARPKETAYHWVTSYGFSAGFREHAMNLPLSPGRGSVVGRVLLERRAVQIADVLVDPEYSYLETQKRGGYRCVLGVPLLRAGNPIGVFFLARTSPLPFTDKQIELVSTFADQAVIAIENTRLLNELRERTDDLSESLEQQTATSEVLRVISSSPGALGPVFQAILENATRICGAKFGNLLLVEGEAFCNVALYGAPEAFAEERRREPVIHPPPGSDLDQIRQSKKIVHMADIADGSIRAATTAIVRLARARTFLNVPMIKDDELIGVIGIYRQEVLPFTEKQIELVHSFAAQAVIAIENARLLHELRQRTDDLSKSLEDLRTTQDRLVQTEKLASLGQLTAGIAHEIKNPLNFVNNFSVVSAELIDELQDTLKAMPFDDKARAEINELMNTLQGNLDKVVQHGKRADAIVKNMLLHSRQGSADHRPVDINALVEESLNLAWHGARAEQQGFNITLEKSLDPSAGEVDVFPQDITRVLLNLISNGFYAATRRKAQADGGDYEPTLMAATRNLGESVEIRIRDNGTGIPPDVKERMFNPFFTTKPAGEGTGLGLSISHDIIVKQHGGAIEVDTTPGEFTEIKITLPRSGVFPTEPTAHV
jgi:two-component system NtrC family sensor kinase